MDTANEIEVLEAERRLLDKTNTIIELIRTHMEIYRKNAEYDLANDILNDLKVTLEDNNE